jgi:type I restriction enzyme S subunit
VSVATIELGQVCRLDRRVTAASEALGKGLEFVGMEHVDPESGRIVLGQGSRTGEGKGQAFLFDDRHVLFGKLRPYLRKIALPGQSGCASTELVPLLPDAARLDRGYLFHWVRRQHVIDALMAKNTGARMPRADMSVLLDMAILLPPLDEQRRIVGLLDRATEIRRRAGAARAKARAIIPAVFLNTFSDPATNPKGWPVVELGDVIARITGGKNIEAGNGASEYRIMKVSAVTSGIFKAHEAKPAPDDYIPSEEHKVRKGDFLFSRANTSELVGEVAIADEVPDGLLLPDKIWRIEWDTKRMEPRYAYSLLRSSEVRRIFAIIGSGTSDSMKNISQAKLVRVPIPLPPLDIQAAFAEQVQRIEALARHLDAAAAKAEAMAAGLSAEVFGSNKNRSENHGLCHST